MTELPAWAKVAVRKIAALGIACGVFGALLWYVVQDRLDVAVAVVLLTVVLVTLLAYNDRYGEPLTQEW